MIEREHCPAEMVGWSKFGNKTQWVPESTAPTNPEQTMKQYTLRVYHPSSMSITMTREHLSLMDRIAKATSCDTIDVDFELLKAGELYFEQIGTGVYILGREPRIQLETAEMAYTRNV